MLIDENVLVSNKKTERKDTKMDMPGIEPGALHMHSKCSTYLSYILFAPYM